MADAVGGQGEGGQAEAIATLASWHRRYGSRSEIGGACRKIRIGD